MTLQRTLSIIKPDATKRNITGKIIQKFEDGGLFVVAQRRILLTQDQAEDFYSVHKERPFYQELVDKKVGSNEVTQFIGEVPLSRAAMHRHLYEEAIVILHGFGRMWTGKKWAEVKLGDVIFLPHRQGHSVECTDKNGMRLMGVFYPSGSPAINY